MLKISFVAGDGVNLEIASAHIGLNYCETGEEPKILLTIEPLDGLQAVVEKKSGYCLSSAVDGNYKLTIMQSLADLSKNS